jgi:hypothetical protein
MRTIVALAVLALAVSAFDPEAYYQGFTQQFGFTAGEVQDGYTCFAAVAQIIQSAQTAIQTRDLNGLLTLAQQAKTQILTACAPYVGDFQTYAMANADGQTPQQVMEQYGPQVIQQFATWANYLAAGQDMEAGQTEAYILQILMGAQQPAVLPTPQYDWSKYQPFNEDAYFSDYLGAFYNTLGLAQQVDLTTIPNCVAVMTGIFQNMTQTEMAFYSGDFDGKIDAVQTFADSLLQGVKSCQGAIDAYGVVMVPVLEAFIQDPVHYLLTVADNAALNFPEILQNIQQQSVDIVEGNYTDAGTLNAQNMQTILKGLVNYAQ